jgi:NitT/TauT family transport system substrate-binding protein
MKSSIAGRMLAAALLAAAVVVAGTASAARTLTPVRLTIDEDPIAIRLATSLGYFRQEGIAIVPVDLEKLSGEDYLMQEALMEGKIDASYHWFNHVVYGARHGFPIKAVMMFNDAPGMTVLVANRVKDRVRDVADFKGRNVAEGAGYGTKSVISHYLATKAGLAPNAYTAVMLEKKGRTEAVIQGLKDGKVDAMTFEEPVVSALMATNMVSPLLDMNTRAATEKLLGAPFPAQSLLVAPSFIAAHPDTVQHLVNALVRSMRFINSHSVDEIVARLPADYFKDKDRDAAIKLIRDTMSTQAKGDYALPPDGVRLVVQMNLASTFDQSGEGRWRAGGSANIDPSDLYTNRFVNAAMKAIP